MATGLKHSMFRLRVKASSLIEVTVAVIIVSMIFGFAASIYLNLQRTGWSGAKLSRAMIVEKVYHDILKAKTFKEQQIVIDNEIIYVTILNHAASADLKVLRIEFRSSEGKLVQQSKHLIYEPAEN
jgi:hypothetical protein